MLIAKIRNKLLKDIKPNNNPNFFRQDWLENPKTMTITELIPATNYDIIHGRIITDKTLDLNDLIIVAQDNKKNTISSDFQCYINEDYFVDAYDQETKNAVEFSIKLDRSSYDCYFIAQRISSKSLIEDPYYLSSYEYSALIEDAERRFPSDWPINDACNINYEERRATQEILRSQKDFKFDFMPKFSIIVPLYNTPEKLFCNMAYSVLHQSYQNFELILVNASRENEDLKKVIDALGSKDKRIKVVELDENKGITLNTATGIKAATGEYISFFDHDDMIEPDLLFHYAKAINDSEDKIALLYCDEDKISENGELVESRYKGDFSIDALLNRNYICHMLTIERCTLKEIWEESSSYDGAQDHNLALKTALLTNSIKHIGRTLYHWRRTDASTASSSKNKTYATEAGIKAVNDYLYRSNIKGTAIKSQIPFTYAIKYDVNNNTECRAIIITLDVINDISAPVRTINTLQIAGNYNITLIGNKDNNNTILSSVGNKENISIIDVSSNEDVINITNNYISQCDEAYVLFVDCNIMIKGISDLRALEGRIQRPGVGAVGPMIEYSDGTIFSAGINVNLPKPTLINRGQATEMLGYMGFNKTEVNYSAISGKCMMTSRDAFVRSHGFRNDYIKNYYDIDYCLKLIEKGQLIIFTPESHVEYFGKFMIDVEENNKSQLIELKDRSVLINEWEDHFINGDPYINRNLGNNNENAFYYLPRTYRKQ